MGPDQRKYTLPDPAEFPRHFINLEAYGDQALTTLPRTPAEAPAKFDAATLEKNGVLPWAIQETFTKLIAAFLARRKEEILFLAADLGYYLADAQVPLHTSLNHNGQLTDQPGIHAFWESQLTELFGSQYNFNVGPPVLLADPVAETWRLLADSHAEADTLLTVEKQLAAGTPPAARYQTDAQGAPRLNVFGQPMHPVAYAVAYHARLHRMVEHRLRLAVRTTASYWYTAWVQAGRPDLAALDAPATTRANARQLKRELRLLQQGQLMDLRTTPEF